VRNQRSFSSDNVGAPGSGRTDEWGERPCPALHIVIFGLAYQLSAVKIVDILPYLPAVCAPDLLNVTS